MKNITGPVSLENVGYQFCSDWLKSELRRLLTIEAAAKNLDASICEFCIAGYSHTTECWQAMHDALHVSPTP